LGREETCHLILLYVLLLNYKVLCVYFCWYTCHVLAYWRVHTLVVLVLVLVLVLEWYWYVYLYWPGTVCCLLPAACCLLPVMGD
jgi:hypothetical protein